MEYVSNNSAKINFYDGEDQRTIQSLGLNVKDHYILRWDD